MKILTMCVFLSAAFVSSAAFAAMGFLKGEQTDGMNKICYYDVLGSTYTLNVASYQLCPISHDF